MTPAEFFDLDSTDPGRLRDLIKAAKNLPREQLDSLTLIARSLKDGNDCAGNKKRAPKRELFLRPFTNNSHLNLYKTLDESL